MTRIRRRAPQVLYALAAVFLAGGVASVFVPTANAATSAGTNWGSSGSTGPTSSAVTVRWDNTATGQPSVDQVPRDSSQILPYTGGQTYADANAQVSATAKQDFGNLAVTADQTQNLGHQAVSLSYTGVANPTGTDEALDVFQCWGGGSTVDGVTEDDPDPTHCEIVNRNVSNSPSDDGPLLAKGDLPSPLTVTVSGFEDAFGTSAHVFAQVVSNGGIQPSGGTVQFATTAGKKLGTSVPVVQGIASADVSGLTKDADTSIIATFTPASGQNYEPAVPSAPLALPDAFSQGNEIGELITGTAIDPPMFEDSLASAATAAGAFKPGDKVRVSLNFGDGLVSVTKFGNTINVPSAGAQVDDLATVKAAADGSATAFLKLPSSVPPNPKAGFGYVLVFTDETRTAARVIDTAGIQGFTPPTSTGVVTSNQPPDDQTTAVPFADIEGNPQAGAVSDFNSDTSNELDGWEAPVSASATTTREFTVNTTNQDPNLGCGLEAATPSTSTCWLVIVPDDNSYPFFDPLTPSAWAQRLQVQLSFAPIPQSCSSSDTVVGGVGSELLSSAMTSWVPAICAADKVDINYASQVDSVARSAYEGGSDSLIFTTRPVDDSGGAIKTLYAPVGLSALTIGLNLPTADGQVTTVNLDARLVAKLLTQSYLSGIFPGVVTPPASNAFDTDPKPYQAIGGGGPAAFVPWTQTTQFADLFADPEFKALNPGFSYSVSTLANLGATDTLGNLVVSSTASDPIGVLWAWILADPEARGFLDGCPDTASQLNGHPTVVNPYFSTETYAQCPSQKAALQKTAKAEIAQTNSQYQKYAAAAAADLASIIPVPSGFSYDYKYSPPTYSATNPQFPLPAWYTIPPNGKGEVTNTSLANSGANLHAEEDSLANVESDISAGAPPWLLEWCSTDGSATCTSGFGTGGEWTKLTANYFTPVLGITDAPASAQFQTVTARLCDDNGHCVGADDQSLLTAQSRFTKTAAAGVLQTSTTPDEAGGAYPLTVPVYAAMNETGLSATDADAYAAMLRYIAATGNEPGLTPGLLPPGYAPLPASMLAQDAAAVKTLDHLAKTAGGGPPSGHPVTPSPSSTAAGSNGSGLPGNGEPHGKVISPSPSASPSATPSPGATTSGTALRSMTPSTPVGFPEYGLVGGLAGAAVCGGAAPLIGRGRRLRKKRSA